MTLIQFVTEMIKALSEFRADWKETKGKLNLNDKRTFADWLFIFENYALKAEDDQPF